MTPNHRHLLTGLMIVAAIGATGCALQKKNQSLSAQIPDDFRVVARAPLEIPPDYGLRPPSPGEPRPQELIPESAAHAALINTRPDPAASPGELALINKASGGREQDNLIKAVIDDEQGDLTHKRKSFADLVMFWKPGDPQVAAGRPDEVSTPIDPAAEAARIATLTANRNVTIIQAAATTAKTKRIFKLPGL